MMRKRIEDTAARELKDRIELLQRTNRALEKELEKEQRVTNTYIEKLQEALKHIHLQNKELDKERNARKRAEELLHDANKQVRQLRGY